jgi:hypothetical protein
MQVNANDAANLVYKSQMVGMQQNLRTDQTVKETQKQQETERARDSNPESSGQDGLSVGSSSGAVRTTPQKKNQQQSVQGQQKLYRGSVEWGDTSKPQQGDEWLPPSLRPQSRQAGTSNSYNVPYWLMNNNLPGQSQNQQNESPQATHRRLLNGLKNMVNIDIQQYVKSNDPPYAKKTLREIYNVLTEDNPQAPQPGKPGLTGEPAGLSSNNWVRAHTTMSLIENPPPTPGEGFEMVA